MTDFNKLIEKVKNIKLDIGEITNVEYKEEGEIEKTENIAFPIQPERLIVTFNLHPTNESNIITELQLPVNNWNGRYLGTGNGGQAGVIVKTSMYNAIARGFATSNTNMGTSLDTEVVEKSRDIQIDFGHRATHLSAIYSKKIIEEFYGKSIKASYFVGGSTGGQQALMEATRYPSDYNGIIAFSPAYNRIKVHQHLHWMWYAANKNEDRKISLELANKVKERVVSLYKEESLSAPTDDFMSYPGKVTASIDEVIDNIRDLGLNDEQLDMYKELYQGVYDPVTKEQIFPGIPYGCEAAAFTAQVFKDTYPAILLFAQKWAFGKDVDLYNFDFHKDYHYMYDMWSDFMDVKPDLKEFKKLGNKLILFTGSTDILIPYKDGMNFYLNVLKDFNNDKDVDSFFKYYHVPGLGHGSGGATIHEIGNQCGVTGIEIDNKHDALEAVMDWYENGNEPFELIASGFGTDVMAGKKVAERPVYPYPYETVYKDGDHLKKESFSYRKGNKIY